MNYWKRYIKFTIGKNVYSAPLSMGFSNTFNMKGSSETKAYIYNPSDETIASAEPEGGLNMPIIIEAGYEDDHGICVIGEINRVSVDTTGFERKMGMKIGDLTTKLTEAKVTRTWFMNVTASIVVEDLVAMLGLIPINVIVGKDKVYPRGLSLNTGVRNALVQMAEETDSDFFIRNGILFFYPKGFPGIPTGIVLSPASGLLGSPKMTTNRAKNGGSETRGSVRSLFNYKIGAGELIRIESESFRGNCKVISGRHSYSDKNAYTEMEVVQV